MSKPTPFLTLLGKRLVFYLGGAWVLVEAFSFLVNQYNLDSVYIDLIILLVLFGIPASIIFTSFKSLLNWKAIALQILNVICALTLVFYYVIHPTSMNPESLRVVKVSQPPKTLLSQLNAVAVLPFFNNMGADQEYLVAGMHDGLISEIGRLGSIHVISRTSVMPYKQTKKNISQIAEELKVDALIEASLTRIDTMVTLRVKLINAFPQESVMWSHSYEVHLGQIPNLFREVTKNVAIKINKMITPEEQAKLAPTRTLHPEAYEAFLKGSYYTGLLTPQNFKKAASFYKKAIESDSLFGEAYCGLATLWASKKQMGYVSPSVANDTIEHYIQKAASIDSQNAMVYSAMAVQYTWGTHEWEKANLSWVKSTQLHPNDAVSRMGYAHFLMIMNRWKEAWKQARYAQELDPESPWVISFTGVLYFFDGKLLSSAKFMEKLKKVAPNHPIVAEVYLEKEALLGNYDASIKYLKTFLHRTQVKDIDNFVDKVYASNDYETTLLKVAQHLELKRTDQYISARIIFQLYSIIDNVENQLKTMIWMYEEEDPNLPYILIKSRSQMQEQPIYETIMKEIGLWEIYHSK